MKIYNRLLSSALIGLYVGSSAGGAQAASVSPEVQQAIDTVYLAAKEANMLNPLDDASKVQINTNNVTPTAEQPQKRTRDPLTQMIAFGLGAATATMAVNYMTGARITAIDSPYSFYSIMFGGMLGEYAYRRYYAPPLPSIPPGIAERVSP